MPRSTEKYVKPKVSQPKPEQTRNVMVPRPDIPEKPKLPMKPVTPVEKAKTSEPQKPRPAGNKRK